MSLAVVREESLPASASLYAQFAALKQQVLDNLSSGQFAVVLGDGVTDNTAALVAAIGSGKQILFRGVSVIGSPTTITAPIVPTMSQIFTLSSQVTIDNGGSVRPEWWGNVQSALDAAINALPAAGGIVDLAFATYKPSLYRYGFGADGGRAITKANLTLRGSKRPNLSSDLKSLVGGTIIQGSVIAYAENIRLENLGVDSGYGVVQTYAGGTPSPGFNDALILSYANDAQAGAGQLRKGAQLHNVVGLCYSPTTPAHAVLAGEGYVDVSLTGLVTGAMGVHGVVFKAQRVTFDAIQAYCNGDDGVIIKSGLNSTTALAQDIQGGSVLIDASGPTGWSPYAVAPASNGAGLKIHAERKNIDRVQIGRVQSFGHLQAVLFKIDAKNGADPFDYTISNVDITSLITQRNAGSGMAFDIAAGGHLARPHIGSWTARDTPYAANFDWAPAVGGADVMVIDALSLINCSYSGICARRGAVVMIGTYTTQDVASAFQVTGTPRIKVADFMPGPGTALIYNAADGGTVPLLGDGWAQVSGAAAFGIDLTGGGVAMRGSIRPGTSNVCATIPAFMRPAGDRYFTARALSGTTVVMAELKVGADGNITVNPTVGGTANCSTSLALDNLWWTL